MATTASMVIRVRVPSVYRSFRCQDGSWGVWGVWVMWGLLGGPRSSPQTPAGLHVASDAPTLCPELRFWVGPYVSLSLWPPDHSSHPWGGPQPPPTLIQIFLPGGRVRGWGGCAVLQVRLCGPALLSDYFCKNCIICGCYPLTLSFRPNLSSRPACTSLGSSEVSAPPSRTGCQGQPSRGP